MAQFGAPPDDATFQPHSEPARTNPLATASLICSLIICCPLTTVVGPILGLISLAVMSSRPNERGRGLAIAGIIIGVIATIVWIVAGARVVTGVREYAEYMQEAPQQILVAGFQGDLNGFRSEFYGAGATLSDDEVREFLDTLRERYGALVSVRIDETTKEPIQPQPNEPRFIMPYVFEFENETVHGDVEFVVFDESVGWFIRKVGSIVIADEELGDVTYPPN